MHQNASNAMHMLIWFWQQALRHDDLSRQKPKLLCFTHLLNIKAMSGTHLKPWGKCCKQLLITTITNDALRSPA